MNDNQTIPLVILAGGKSRRMGRDKALVDFNGKRLINHAVDRYRDQASSILLSAPQDYGTGVKFIPDNPDAPDGPVGAIFSISEFLTRTQPDTAGFCTIPVDAPFAPDNLIQRLTDKACCAVAESNEQLHPTFAFWQCQVVEAVRLTHDLGTKSPSLHWLARQCGAEIVEWDDELAFANINKPEDLVLFEKDTKTRG